MSTFYTGRMTERIRIGQLAARCGVTRDTIRFYERAGLLPKPRRTTTRHRIYDQKTAEQILFIRRSQDLGLTLDDIRQLIELSESDSPMAGRRVAEILRLRLETIESRITSFEKFRDRLRHLVQRAGERPDGNVLLMESTIDDHRSLKEA
jgi:MerR family mercuric resistance operon transcriptional regulator